MNDWQSVLFLGTGNFYRSRYAEAWFNYEAPRHGLLWRAESKGFRPHIETLPLSHHAAERLSNQSVPRILTRREPGRVQESDLAEASLIVALYEREHRPMMEDRFPRWTERSGGLTISRNPRAKYWIPSEDEWYKTAYHQPTGQGGDGDDYWLYPTKSTAVPGNTIGVATPFNHANFFTSVYSVTQSGSFDSNRNYLTAVGAYTGSGEFYGTFDQGGNVFEWNDAVFGVSARRLRGGSWISNEVFLRSTDPSNGLAVVESDIAGFRVASP